MPLYPKTQLDKNRNNLIDDFATEASKGEFSSFILGGSLLQEVYNQSIIYKKPNFEMIDVKNKKVIQQISLKDVKDIAHTFSDYSYTSDYREIIKDQQWLDLYGYGKQNIRYKFGTKWQDVNINVMPCYYCGLALPLTIIEVDHWFEKKGHGLTGLMQAVIKVFRSLNTKQLMLVQGDSTGNKAAQFDADPLRAYKVIGTRGKLANTGDVAPNLNKLIIKINDIKARTLTDKGNFVLSILWGATHKQFNLNEDNFSRLFVNHFINLVPSCPACNKAKNSR